jgi:hypothetical protein
MNRIWIVCVDGVRVVDAASVQPANRIKPAEDAPKKPAAKKPVQAPCAVFANYSSGTMSSASVHRFGIRLR